MSIARFIRDIARQGPVIETATVAVVGSGSATVKRAGQTTATKALPVASGLTVVANDVVEIVKLNGNINTAYISRKIR